MFQQRLFSTIIFLSFLGLCFWGKGWLGASTFIVGSSFLIWQSLNEIHKILTKISLPFSLNLLRIFSFTYIALVIFERFALFVPYSYELFYLAFFITCFLKHKLDLSKTIPRFILLLVVFIYIPWSLSFIAQIYFLNEIEPLGRYLVLLLILGVKFADIGAYLAGKICSNFWQTHKIIPKISPGKSWEGFFGGMIFSTFICCIIYFSFEDISFLLPFYSCFVLGFCFNILGFLGDILESSFKRRANFKDSGQWIPGIGGALDGVDSLILSTPIYFSFLQYYI